MIWRRPLGPPRVWNVTEIIDSNGNNLRFSIQEIPKDRYDEALDHMFTYFLRDETILSSLGIANNETYVSDFRNLWKTVIHQGISIAAYDITENPENPMLAGMNLLLFGEEYEKKVGAFQYKEETLTKIVNFMVNASEEVNTLEVFGTKEFLDACGLSVNPKYRRLGLGTLLLAARNDIGREYNITCTQTLFSGLFSQIAAARAGFVECLVRSYDDAIDEYGQKLLPQLSGKQLKIMGKRIS